MLGSDWAALGGTFSELGWGMVCICVSVKRAGYSGPW